MDSRENVERVPEGSRPPSGPRRLTTLTSYVLRIGVAAFLLYLVLKPLEHRSFLRSLATAQPGFLLLASLSFVAIAILEMARLWVVCRPFELGTAAIAKLYLVSAFVSGFLPGQTGGDIYKIVRLRQPAGGLADPIVRIVLIRGIGIFVVIAAGLVCLVTVDTTFLRWQLDWPKAQTLAIAGILGIIASGVVAFQIHRRRRFLTWNTLVSALRSTIRGIHPRDIAFLVALSLGVLVARTAVMSFLILAVHGRLSLIPTLTVVVAATLATVLPISLAGLGVRESVSVYLLTVFGLSYSSSASIALLSRALMLIAAGLGALWLSLDSLAHYRK